MSFQRFMNFDEMVIDSFAGGGGASTGIEQAIGRSVDIAINHNAEALKMHAVNHPNTIHLCESVWDVDPCEVTKGRPVGLLWLSPDCKHFSKAKGSKPVEKKIRGLAWVSIRWAAKVRPRLICLENVEEFVTWGPLVKNKDGDMFPCPKRKGREFQSFCNALRYQGYKVEYRELRACNYGAPTIRKRFFLIARRDGLPITWPESTHGDPKSDDVISGKLLAWKTAADCIDWSIPCPSIFERKKILAENTLKRIAKGIQRYVIQSDEPFIVPENNVVPFVTEHANASSQRNMDANEPLRTQCAQVKGGHFGLVSVFLAKHYTGVVGTNVDGPLHTITSQDHHSVVACNLTSINQLDNNQNHAARVRDFLIKYYGTGEGQSINSPLNTITIKDGYAIVTVKGEDYAITDIGLRMFQPRELFLAQGFPDDYIIGDDESQGLKLTKAAQVRMCGNSVCPDLAAALVQVNYQSQSQLDKAA